MTMNRFGHSVPTLTDTLLRLDLDADPPPAAGEAAASASSRSALRVDDDAAFEAALFVEPLLEQLVHQLDALLALRIREAVAPELERLAQRLVQAARDEVAMGLREMVERIVTQELARRRAGG